MSYKLFFGLFVWIIIFATLTLKDIYISHNIIKSCNDNGTFNFYKANIKCELNKND